MESHILKNQLDVTAEEFWDCVSHGNKPDRGESAADVPKTALPADLMYQLVPTLGLEADEIEGLSLDDAVQRLTEHWPARAVTLRVVAIHLMFSCNWTADPV